MPPLYTGEIGTKLGSYLSNSLFIPRIQRGYVWTPAKVAEYLDCIWAKLMGGDAPDASPQFWAYSIYVWEDEQSFKKHIVDGQQRSITMFVAFLALRDLFGDVKPAIKAGINALLLRHSEHGAAPCITSSYPDDNAVLHRLACGTAAAAAAGPAGAAAAAGTPANGTSQQMQAQQTPSKPPRRRRGRASSSGAAAFSSGGGSGAPSSSQLIQAAYEAARDKLKQLLGDDADKAATLLGRLRSSFLVDVFKITDLADAAELFENINSKGVKITAFDLSCCIIMHKKESEEGVTLADIERVFCELHRIDKQVADIRGLYDARQMATDKVLLLASEHLQQRIERHAYANCVKSITALLATPTAVAAASATSAAAAAAAAAAGSAGGQEQQEQQEEQQQSSMIDTLLSEAAMILGWIEATYASPFGFAAMQFVPFDVLQFFVLPLARKHGTTQTPAFKQLLQTLAAAAVRSGAKAVQEGSRHMSSEFNSMRGLVAEMWRGALSGEQYVAGIRQQLLDAHGAALEEASVLVQLCNTRFSKAAVKGLLLLEEAYELDLAAAVAAADGEAAAAAAAARAASAGRMLAEHGVAPYKLSGNTGHASGSELLGNWVLLAPGFGAGGKRNPCFNPSAPWGTKKRKLGDGDCSRLAGLVLVTSRVAGEMAYDTEAEVARMTERRGEFLELETAVSLFERDRPKHGIARLMQAGQAGSSGGGSGDMQDEPDGDGEMQAESAGEGGGPAGDVKASL